MVYGYIYLIRNKINNKLYIGQTINNFDKRYANNIILNTHNKHLKSSLEKYGIDNFIIIKEFDKASSKEELDLLEIVFTLAIGECAYNDINNIQKLEDKIKTINNLCKKQKEVIDKAIGYIQENTCWELRTSKVLDILKGEQNGFR